MGLDVHLYQFKDVDTDVILELSRLAEEPYSDEEFQKWKAMPPFQRGDSFPSAKRKAEGYQKLLARARELGFPETRFSQPGFGGTGIDFPSPHHPEWAVGDWYSLGTTCGIMKHFTGNDIYSVFPEAKDLHGLFRPDWSESRKQLMGILQELKRMKPAEIESFISGLSESFDHHLNQLEVMIETLDFVVNSGNPREFLLFWSA